MKYKVGDKVKIKSKEWFFNNHKKFGYVNPYVREEFYGKKYRIVEVTETEYTQEYRIGNDCVYSWEDEMFEEDTSTKIKNLLREL